MADLRVWVAAGLNLRTRLALVSCGRGVCADREDLLGGTAVQIVHSSRKGSRKIEHLGSAHSEEEVAALKVAAAKRLAGGQDELDLGIELPDEGAAASAEPLPIVSSRMGHLCDGLSRAYDVLGFDDLWGKVSGGGSDPLPEAIMTFDTSISAIEAVARGVCWAIVPERFVRRDVREGRVLLALDAVVPMRQSHYLLRRDDGSQLSGAAATFVQWLRAQDSIDPSLTSGRDR